MYGQCSITITPIANGWLVILPNRPTTGERDFGMPMPTDEQLRHAVKVMTDMQNKEVDPIMAKIKAEAEKEEKAGPNFTFESDESKKVSYDDLRDMNVYTFTEFDDVLKFLDKEVNGKK